MAISKYAQELEEFKQKVVKVALVEADSRGWCDEIYEVLEGLGLKDYLPERFAVQRLESKRHKNWQDWDSYGTKEEAVEDADTYFGQAVARKNAPRDWGVNRYLSVDLYNDDPEKIADMLKKAQTALTAPKKVDPVDVYPKYRVVSEKTGETVHEAVYVEF